MRRRVTVFVLCAGVFLCYHLVVNIVHFYALTKVLTALFLHFQRVDFRKTFRSDVMAYPNKQLPFATAVSARFE